MSQALVFASSTIFATAVYSMNVTGTPAWVERARPISTVVPVSEPVVLSFAPMTGFPVNTAARSVPVGASSVPAAGLRMSDEDVLAQPVMMAMRNVSSVPAVGDRVWVIRFDVSPELLGKPSQPLHVLRRLVVRRVEVHGEERVISIDAREVYH